MQPILQLETHVFPRNVVSYLANFVQASSKIGTIIDPGLLSDKSHSFPVCFEFFFFAIGYISSKHFADSLSKPCSKRLLVVAWLHYFLLDLIVERFS